MMTESYAEIKIRQLTQEINKHNHAYYILDDPKISDYDFDLLMQELQELEIQFPQFILPDSPSYRVGGGITKHFTQVKHDEAMYSLNNSYSRGEIIKFDERVRKQIDGPVSYTCELKFDGVAISLIYKNGKLLRAVTRGNGIEGDDVTLNIKTIRSIPLSIDHPNVPQYFEVRGEVFIPIHTFQQLNQKITDDNEQRVFNGQKPLPLLANPRNTTSGTLKMQDSRVVAKRKLDCFIYTLIIPSDDELSVKSNEEAYRYLSNWNFKISPHMKLCRYMNEIFQYIENWHLAKWKLPVNIDGIVIKVNEHAYQKALGYTSKAPRWAIAFKYPAEQVCTQIKSIQYQVGRTGAITPVANLVPVQLNGTIVKRASLHNANEINRLNLFEKDHVWVEKGGEIIPKITQVDISKRVPNTEKVTFITHCPACSSLLQKNEGEAAHYCLNSQFCRPQQLKKLEHFISKNAMNIISLGNETLKQLFEKGLIKDAADLFTLGEEDLQKLEGFKEKSIQNLLDGISDAKKQPFEKLLFGLGIRFVGVIVARRLAYHFKSLDHLIEATYEDYIAVDEIGIQIAQSLTAYFGNPKVCNFINKLKKLGLQTEFKDSVSFSGSLQGKSFVVSGKFTESRDQIKNQILRNGGKVVSSVSGRLSYLVGGDKIGTEKRRKAEKLGISIISEYDLKQMIKASSS